ncbi:hypothetical protein K458DRAFT_348432 [Lentithecium fluviatile CBS 122367]|uniref:Altered inheritance of mitochondria protein 21 n=1 Tax=Lentithecium fluviatile CBS 122367 TaxID=1168545 RepID=A0A6G1IJH0_9PLEO|nr:hypothetical protein K458DRAFT_348432 [Lentithecium fluviatile CBS 122367]
MSAPPQIPPRPSRAQAPAASATYMDVPKIPPRPKRSVDRSISPNRDAFTRSPLNDPTFDHKQIGQMGSRLSTELPPRPPSVSLPSLGEEGNEYASFEDLSKTLTNQSEAPPQQKAQVAGDLPLYAPTAEVPSSTAKSRIQTVTRTDSQQAAAAGFGKLLPDDRSTVVGSGSSVGGNTRPSSVYREEREDEQGIPEIGLQVPMYPNAGDVQAPTPSPYEQQAALGGVGSFNKGQPTPRHHTRTKSGREIFTGPPGSYGLHGHGKIGKDEFEQQWYAKHPEDHKREKAGEYGPHIQENRKDYNWESHKLDKLVREARAHGHGLGTSREAIGTPDEQIGYMATEEYASRMASPQPPSGRPGSISGKSGPVAESPLRQSNFPTDALTKQKTNESEAEEDVIHIDPPSHRASKIGGGGYDPPKEDLGPEGGNTEEAGGWVSERGYGIPILASDQIEKNKEAEWRQPAVSPELERRASGEYTVNEDGMPAYVTKPRTHSRSSSRNNSMTGNRRFIPSPAHHDRNGTPLESTKEYEPLFPEDEEHKPKSPVDKLKKRPDLARHHFPSQDVWEDTPSSLQLETTVDTPQAPEEPSTPGDVGSSKVFEQPKAEQARKENITKEDQQSFLPDHTKRFANKHLDKEHLGEPTRPGMRHRFPSQDVWEDAPDHGKLETTVSGPQTEETEEYADDSPAVDKQPAVEKPSLPSKHQKPKELSPVEKKAPVLPERPKPQVPIRPSKPLTKSSEKVPTLASDENAEGSAQPKAKPAVPARPAGSKIAALQAGFLKDLNSKLGLGPPKPKEPEPEEEPEPPKPLTDARKGRAKGPQRRKPAASPAPAATVTSEVAVPRESLSLQLVSTVWQIGDDGVLDAPAAQMSAKLHEALKPAEKGEEVETKEPVTAEEVLGKEEHVQPGEADLEPTLVKDAPSSTVEEPAEAPDEPVAGQTTGKTEPVVADRKDAEPLVEDKVPGGFPAEEKEGVEKEILTDTAEKLAAGGGEGKAEKAEEVNEAKDA